jgi:hypothetical protein
LRWDPGIGDFTNVSTLTYPMGNTPDFEVGAFAPFSIPLISPQP